MFDAEIYKPNKYTGYDIRLSYEYISCTPLLRYKNHHIYLFNGNNNLNSKFYINIGNRISISLFTHYASSDNEIICDYIMRIFTDRNKNQIVFFQHLINTYKDKIYNLINMRRLRTNVIKDD